MPTTIDVKDAAGSTQTVPTLEQLVTQIGEVQATPTANTLLRRLKDLLTGIVLSAGSAIIGKVGIDQTTPGTTDRVTANLDKVAGSAISQGHGTAAAAIRVELPTDGTGVVGVAPAGYTSQPTVTRPANATAYTAGDVVGGAITFTNAGPSGGGHVVVTGDDLRIDVAAVPSGMTTFRLYLYSVTPPSAIADNSPWDLPSGDRASYLGYLDLGTPVDLGSTLFVQTDGVNKKLLLASSSVFGYLVTTAGYTPAGNSEVYTPRLQAVGV